MSIILGDPWILLHFKKHIKHTGRFSGSLEGKANRPCQLLELKKPRPGTKTPFVWYTVSDAAHHVAARIDQAAHENYLRSDNHSSRKPLVLLRAYKSEWCKASNPDADPIPVITITELGHLSTQEDTLGQPRILSHALFSWWETHQKPKTTEDADSSLVPEKAIVAGNSTSQNVSIVPVAGPSEVARKRRTLLERWPGLVLSEETCSISKADRQILDKLGFAGALTGTELSRQEETTEEPSPDGSVSSKSDDDLDWSASPEITGKPDDELEDIEIKEEEDEVLQQLEEGDPSPAQGHTTEEPRAEVQHSEYPSQPSGKEAGATIIRPAILVPDSDTSMTQSTHSQSLSQTRHLHHLPPPNSSIEHPSSSSSVPSRDPRTVPPPASMPPVWDKGNSSSKEAFRSSTPLGHSSSFPSNVDDADTSPDGKSTSSRTRGPKLKSRPSWARAMTNEEAMRRISTPLRDPQLGSSADSSPLLPRHPSANLDASSHFNALSIKAEQQSQAWGLPSSSPQANIPSASMKTRIQETSKAPRVLGARTNAQRTTAQKYQELSDILAGTLSEYGREE